MDFHSHSFAARFLQASLQSARALILTRRDNMIDASLNASGTRASTFATSHSGKSVPLGTGLDVRRSVPQRPVDPCQWVDIG